MTMTTKLTKPRIRVLVVDDDQAMLTTLEAILSADFDVVMARSGRDALRLLDAKSFHVVCTDYQMPAMNGLELLNQVSTREEYISCLLVTGDDEYFKRESAGGFYVLLKPFSAERLIAIVKQLANVAQMKRAVNDMLMSQTGRHMKP
jgi:DNA-binding NtrC family response regulator